MHIQEIKFSGIDKFDRWFKILVVVGVICLILSFVSSPTRAWINLLVNNFYFISLSLFGGFFLALLSVTNSSFGTPYKRILEAMTAFLPYGLAAMMLLIFFGGHYLYIWTHSDVVMSDAILKGKSTYLNTPFFTIRTFVYFGLWILFTKIFVSKSREQDHSNTPTLITQHLIKYSAIFLVIFALTYCLASFDWIMSLEPHWFSTVFGIYCFSSLFVMGIAFVSVSIITLQDNGYLKSYFNENQYHDLAKLLLGFTTFFAYIWFCQYLLIWYANISEEAEYYVLREHYGWDWLFWLNVIINWVIPFVVLLPRKVKRGTSVLFRVSLLVLVGQWLNIYILVAPKVYEHLGVYDPQVGWQEVGIALGFVGAFGLIFLNELKKASLLPLHDPYLQEGLALEQ